MRLATFTRGGRRAFGVVQGDEIIDVSGEPGTPNMMAVLHASDGFERVRQAAARSRERHPLSDVRLEAPVPNPRKFLGIGLNYPRSDAAYAAEAFENIRRRGDQVWFNKQVTSITGPFNPIELPRASNDVIYEAELAFVIGRSCRHVSRDEAITVIAGYLICNDVTAADWMTRSPTATLGKSFDTHGPTGPWLVTADEIDPHALTLRSFVNGEERQKGNTADMVFNCFDMIAYLSQIFTLEAGDILTTGTPNRVTKRLEPGDLVRCEIDGLGHIENPVIREPEHL